MNDLDGASSVQEFLHRFMFPCRSCGEMASTQYCEMCTKKGVPLKEHTGDREVERETPLDRSR